jgi:threonine/homoserine/homoserine lactone efflux protein
MLDPKRYPTAARDPFGRPALRVPFGHAIALALQAFALVGIIALAIVPAMPALLRFFAIGVGIGVATCIPIGIANVIVLDAAYRHGARRAIGAAIGGTLADGIYAGLGMFGLGQLIGRYPFLPPLLQVISGCVLVVYGIVLLRTRPVVADVNERQAAPRSGGQLGTGFVVGLGATLLNPSAIVTWIVIVGGHATGVAPMDAAAWLAGVMLGTFGWFLVVTFLTLRGRRVMREKAAWMTRFVGAIVIATGMASFAQVVFGAS